MGGLGVILSFYVGVSVLVIFASEEVPRPSVFYASLSAVLGAGVVGLIDDMFRLRRRMKALLPFLLALPLGAAVYSSGDTRLLGLDLGLLIVLAIPFGITSAANAANMLEGLNGLGAGTGVIMCAGLIALAFVTGTLQGLYILFPLAGALLAFLCFNKYPAKVFPGDSMTLFMGAALAAAAIISEQKTLGALLFIPMIAEFLLKLRGGLHAENYGTPDPAGRLHYQGRLESLTHVIMRRRPSREWQVVGILWLVEAILACAVVAAAVVF
jgi:UDP-N-acetylglucosamine--dolichyl-phosphate N-acetylglucosaminephosphotransferase